MYKKRKNLKSHEYIKPGLCPERQIFFPFIEKPATTEQPPTQPNLTYLSNLHARLILVVVD